MSTHDSLVGSDRRPQTAMVRIVRRLATKRAQILLACSVASAAALLIGRLDQGWFPHDDGSLAHSAERVVAGELPHRDFADLYTGLLSFTNAAVFSLVGEDLFNLRLPLFVLFLAFAGCFFALAQRLVSPAWAFVATLFAIAWSVPIYPAPMPSWYLLFLSTIGMYTIVRFFETGRRRWLFLAGICGGISMAIKIVGVWYVAAVLLALLTAPLLSDATTRSSRQRSRKHAAIVILTALLALGLVVAVLSGRLGAGEVVGLLVPVTALCGAVALVGLRAWAAPLRGPGGATLREVAVFLAGVGAPVALFVAPYALTGSVGDLVEGVLVTPQSRFEFASSSMPHPATLLRALPVMALLLVRSRVSERRRNLIDVAAGAVIVLLALTAASQPSYSIIWGTTRALAPFVFALGVLAILRRGQAPPDVQPAVVVLVVLVGGFSMLIQFPFAVSLYFIYVAPLVLLAAIASLRRVGGAGGLLPGVVLIALVVFGIRQLDHQTLSSLGHEYRVEPRLVILDDDRASVRVRPEVKRAYEGVLQLVTQHRPIGRPIFAGPDAPEIYFLTRLRNPTPSILDFLDASGTTRGSRLIRLLREEDVRVVVLNLAPRQSPPLAPATIERIRSIYRDGERVGRFEVRWIATDRSSTD